MRWRDALPTEKKNNADRALADHLASSDDEEHNKRAIDIYESLLSDDALTDENRHDVLHNAATLYSSRGNRELAREKWVAAYEIDPTDPAVRAAFSQRLSSWGEMGLAMKVVNGDPLE